jgi:hypothetical protein
MFHTVLLYCGVPIALLVAVGLISHLADAVSWWMLLAIFALFVKAGKPPPAI